MEQLRQAAARERRFTVIWWLVLMVITGAILWVALHPRAPYVAGLAVILLALGWLAPLLAIVSLSAPRRARKPPPKPGEGTFADWHAQARLLGRVLLYHQDNPDLPPELGQSIHAARGDLRDTLSSHPLRDDLERVCGRLRKGALAEVKTWLWHRNGPVGRDPSSRHDAAVEEGLEPTGPLAVLKHQVEDAAATMVRRSMPRMLERERLVCTLDCGWVAAHDACGQDPKVVPTDLAAALVVEWCDFSEPWDPDRMLERALHRLATSPIPATGPEDAESSRLIPMRDDLAINKEEIVVRNGKRYRRVRVRRRHSSGRHHADGASLRDILLSFGQWVRYSVRSWMLYR